MFFNYLVGQIYLSIWTSHTCDVFPCDVHVCPLRKVRMVFSYQFLKVCSISDSMVSSFFVVLSSSDRITAVALLIYLGRHTYLKRSRHVCLSQLCILCNWKHVTKQQFCERKIMSEQVVKQLRWTEHLITSGVTLNSCCFAYFKTGSHLVQAGLELLMIFLLQFTKCWDCRCLLSYLDAEFFTV